MKALTPVIFLAISIGIFFWYINPTYSAIGAARASLTQYQAALTEAQQGSAKRDELVNRYNSFSADQLDRLQKFLPDSVNNIDLLVDLNNLAEKYNSSTQDISISSNNDTNGSSAGANAAAPAANQVYGTLTVSFTVSMTYANFLSYMEDMEQNLRLTDISVVNFKPSDSSQVYDYNVTINTYWLE
jgi:hypothetical protein